MFKLIAAVALFICFSAAGKYFADKKSKKSLFFSSLCEFNGDYIKEMRFSRRPLSEILSEKYASPSFNALLGIVKKNQGATLNYNDNLLRAVSSGFSLNEKEKKDVISYFLKLGKSDAFSQTEECMRYDDIFKKYFSDYENEEKKYGTLYKKLGVVFGLMAFVVAI